MAEARDVKIVAWPKEPAKLEHSFNSDKPCPVTISFQKEPAILGFATSTENPMHVDMNMKLSAEKPVPVCIQLCEPICVKSEYVIGIDIFDRPVGSITFKGMSRLFMCRDNQLPQVTKKCVTFNRYKVSMHFSEPFINESLTFAPLGEELKIVGTGDPAGTAKLGFPPQGVRVTFPFAVKNVEVMVNNYAGSEITAIAYRGETEIGRVTESVQNEVKTLALEYDAITAVDVQGGRNEAAIIQICYWS
ncbi:MAG TPA: hypothetical protein VK470_10190 [Bacteroidota bacterium]|nr:hypothetical protein [Bacteroidota bacterium]